MIIGQKRFGRVEGVAGGKRDLIEMGANTEEIAMAVVTGIASVLTIPRKSEADSGVKVRAVAAASVVEDIQGNVLSLRGLIDVGGRSGLVAQEERHFAYQIRIVPKKGA